MDKPLNETLYHFLSKVGKVRIAKQGVPMVNPHMIFNDNMQKWQLVFDETGEYYVMTCPCCRHHNPTLWINHRWQTTVDVSGHGEQRLDHLATCYYCGAEKERVDVEVKTKVGNRYVRQTKRVSRLHAAFLKYTEKIEKGERIKLIESSQPARPTVFIPPPPGVPLQSLGQDSPAVQYLQYDRKHVHDPVYLGEAYGLTFVEDYVTPNSKEDQIGYAHSRAHMRIVIPTIKDGRVMGWQACATIPGDSPKYYFPPGPRLCHFRNWDVARRFKGVILVEGFWDEVSAGPSGLTIFGKSLNFGKALDIVQQWDFIIIALDAYEHQKEITEKRGDKTITRPGAAFTIKEMLQSAGAKHAPMLVTYPEVDVDPGDLGPRNFWELIRGSVPHEYIEAATNPDS